MKVKWLDRNLFMSPYYYGLATTEATFYAALKSAKVPREDWPADVLGEHSNATVHYVKNTKGQRIALVFIKPKKDTTGVQIAALLVHEAMHIWRRIREDVGEWQPSREFEAYAMQCISQELMQAYADTLKPRRRA